MFMKNINLKSKASILHIQAVNRRARSSTPPLSKWWYESHILAINCRNGFEPFGRKLRPQFERGVNLTDSLRCLHSSIHLHPIDLPQLAFIHLHLPWPPLTFMYLHLPPLAFNYLRPPSSASINLHLPSSTNIYLHYPSFRIIQIHLPLLTFI